MVMITESNVIADFFLSLLWVYFPCPQSDHGRLSFFVLQCCQALAAAACSVDEATKYIVPRILFLDNYFRSENKSLWTWTSGVKMHVMGSLILQAVFRYKSVCKHSCIFNGFITWFL